MEAIQKKMKYTFYSLLTLLVICIFLKTCVCKTAPVVVVDSHVRDSVFFAKRVDSLQKKILSDSLGFDEERKSDDTDRESILDDKQDVEERAANAIAKITIEKNKWQVAYQNKDTAAANAACREYMAQTEAAYKVLGARYKNSFDSLVANAAERRAIDSSERGLVYQGIRMDGNTIDTMRAWHQTDMKTINDFANRLKKVDKRFGIGASVGITYYGVGFRPYVGIGVHYTLIRF